MSALLPCRAYHNASDLPPEFWGALRQSEAAANTILPFAKKALDSPSEAGDGQLWIILYDDTGKDVDFVLSCTRGPLGNYPIFMFTAKSSAQLAQDASDGREITHSLSQLVLCLLQEVPPQRIFSVFSIAYVAEKFAEVFKAHMHQEHGIQPLKDPYYDAMFAFCTRETLNESPASFSLSESKDILISLCPADSSHLEGVTALCKAFSLTSPPYTLDDARAETEARTLIANKQVWVHLAKKGDKYWETVCLVATTRQSENVTAVTKVITAEHWRGHGCAARLLYRVCQEILQNKTCVVLYVGNSGLDELAAAHSVYRKVGFQGLGTKENEKVEGMERWLEIGFTDTELGYW